MPRSYIVNKVLQVMRATGVEKAPVIAIGIDVRDGVLLKFVAMGFDPLGRAQQARFFAVPGAEDDGPLRVPSLFMQFAEHASFFQNGHHARDWVLGAVDPGIVVIAADHPLLGRIRSAQGGDHVVDRLQVPVGNDFQMNFRGAGADVISDGQGPSPFLGRNRPLQGGKQRQRIGIRNRQHGNFGDGFRVFDVKPLGVGSGADSGSERIAGIIGVHDAAALHAVARPPSAFRIVVALEIAIALGIGINDAADRPMLGSDFGLDAAPAFAVARDYDGAFDGNSHPVELLVIFAVAVVDVNERGGHVSIDGIRVIGRQLFGGLIGGGIARNGGFLKLGSELGGLDHFDDALFGRREKHLEGLDVGVQSPFFEFGEDPVRIVFVVGRAHMVGTRTQTLHVVTQIRRDDGCLEFFLPIALGFGRLRRVTGQAGSIGRRSLSRLRKSEMGDGDHGERCDKRAQ